MVLHGVFLLVFIDTARSRNLCFSRVSSLPPLRMSSPIYMKTGGQSRIWDVRHKALEPSQIKKSKRISSPCNGQLYSQSKPVSSHGISYESYHMLLPLRSVTCSPFLLGFERIKANNICNRISLV